MSKIWNEVLGFDTAEGGHMTTHRLAECVYPPNQGLFVSEDQKQAAEPPRAPRVSPFGVIHETQR